MANLSLLVPVLLLALFVNDGESVRCWTCASNLNLACNDPFMLGRGGDDYYRDNIYNAAKLENCDANTGATYPYLSSSKSACKKQKKYINGEMVVIRGCTWKRADDYTNSCPSTNTGSYDGSSSSCETCEYDGCNGAAAIGKTLALLIAPMALLLFK